MVSSSPVLSTEDECRLLLDMARRCSTPRIRQSLHEQAESLASGVQAGGSWAIKLEPDDPEDGPVSAWLVEHGQCGICDCGYEDEDTVFFVRPLVTAHRRCMLAGLPPSEADLDAALAMMAAERAI